MAYLYLGSFKAAQAQNKVKTHLSKPGFQFGEGGAMNLNVAARIVITIVFTVLYFIYFCATYN